MARRKKDHNAAPIAWAIIVAILFYFIGSREWAKLFIYVTLVLAFAVPTQCRVITGRRTPCKLTAYGLIFGCWEWHFLDKARARIGRYQQAIPRTPPVSTQRRRGGGAEFETNTYADEAMPVRILQSRKERIFALLAAVGACCAILTSLTPIAKWIASLFS